MYNIKHIEFVNDSFGHNIEWLKHFSSEYEKHIGLEEQKIAEELTHVDDQLQGPWLQYYTDGTIKMKGQYENGVKTGLFILNHPNGKLEAKGMYANSLKEGLWEQFDEEGNITKEEIYRRGKLIEEK